MSKVTTVVVNFFRGYTDSVVAEVATFSGNNGTNLGIEIGDYATEKGYASYQFAQVDRK